jgi:hypothetical protein
MVIDKSKFVNKHGDYAIAQTGGIADPLLLGTATKYEEALSRSFKALSPADISSRFDGVNRLHWSEKYDGEGALLFYDKNVDTVAFAAPSGRARMGMQALKNAAATLKAKGIKKALLRGEIYLPAEKGKPRHSIAEVTRASFSVEKGAADKLTLALYDILMLDGKDYRDDGGGFDEEWEKLGEIFGDDEAKLVHRARGGWCSGDELGKMLDQVLADGGEGVVVRHEKERDYAKIKPLLTIDAAIIGYVEGSSEGKIGVRSIFVALTHPAKGDSTIFQTLTRIGSGIDDKMAVDLLERLKGLEVEAPLLLNDSDGREVNFVKPEIIVEIKGEDWNHNRTDGRPVRTQAFTWDSKKGAWSYAGVSACPRLIFPTFGKMREDKSVKDGGARIAQALEDACPPVKPPERTEAEVIERIVYRKGKDAVRKFILAKRGSEDALPYIFSYTDFSAGRKDPLKVATAYAYTETRARALLEACLADNVKKGWEKV